MAAAFCQDLYKLSFTPEFRCRNLAASISWGVAAVAGAGMMIAARLCPVAGPRRPYADHWKHPKSPLRLLVWAEAAIVLLLVMVVPILGAPVNEREWVLTLLRGVGSCLILNFLLLLLGLS